jgi:hypothetical protein
MIKILEINDSHLPMLEVFCDKCKDLGYMNNSSFKSMKLDWCREVGKFFCAIKDDEIIAVAGCHPFEELSTYFDNPWRILFRGCELPGKDVFKGLSKRNWNSITQREFIPIFIRECPTRNLFLTTNIDHEHSNGKAARNHRLMQLLSKQGILDHFKDMIIYNTHQSVWTLNIDRYEQYRSEIKNVYVDK